MSEKVEITKDEYQKLFILARRTLYTAYTWNYHNFSNPDDISRGTAKSLGINNADQADDFLSRLPACSFNLHESQD